MKTMSMSCREDCHEVAQGILTFCLVWLVFGWFSTSFWSADIG
jgi:hypothetical protein